MNLLTLKGNFLFVLLLLVLTSFMGAGQTASYTTSSSWTAPCDVTSVQVACWGGGGAGGGTNTNSAKGGGGGAGGAYAFKTVTVIPGTTYTITVGGAVSGAQTAGAQGNASWFGSVGTVYAEGGAGGAAPNGGTVLGGAGSAGNSIGDIVYAGGDGADGTSTLSGGGGGGAGSSAPGDDASGTTAGVATANNGGAGAAGRTTGGAGAAGSTYGGGGGGAFVNNTTNRNGGNGAAGRVELTYTSTIQSYCTPTFTSAVEPITNVNFAGIDNTTSSTVGGTPALEQFCDAATVVQGSTGNAISVSGNTDGSYTNYISVYIDWNNDGLFTGSDEYYELGTIYNCNGCAVSTTIDVPCTAIVGNTSMRVMKRFGGYATSACQTGTGYGQAEDYMVTITAAPGSSAPTDQPSSLALSAVSGTQINGSFTAAASNPSHYIVLRTGSASAPSINPVNGTSYAVGDILGTATIASIGTTTSFSATSLSANTSYWFWIYSFNGACTPQYYTVSPLSGTTTTLNQINWNGAGVSGGTGNSDFNTAANWLPTTVPGSSDMAVIATTTAATITLSANTTVGSLSILNDATGAVTLAFDVSTYSFTVVGDMVANDNVLAGSSTTLSLRVGNSPGNFTIGGNTYLGNNGNADAYIGFTGSAGGTTTGSFTFKGDVTYSVTYGTLGGYIGSFIWDGTGNQTIYTNNTYAVGLNGSCQIGGTNTPTVTVSNTTATGLYVNGIAATGDLTVKAGSTLDLSTKYWNKSTSGSSVAGGVLTLEAGAILKLGAGSGGQTGSNFPLNFTTSNPVLNASSTVEYSGTTAQTIYDVASPGYGNLTFSGNATRTAGADLDIQGNVTIGTSSTFDAGTSRSHAVGGNWTNNGSFSYTTDNTITLNGTASQAIGGTTSSTFYNLTNSNASTGLTLGSAISVLNTLSMAGATADLDLNGYTIDLSTTGSLTGETATDRILGTSGSISATRTLNNITAQDVAGLGAVLTTGANMGVTVITRGHGAQSGIGLVSNTLNRYYQIDPTNDTGLNATLVYNYYDSELNGLSGDEGSLELYKSEDYGVNWTEEFGAVNTTANTITLSAIGSFSLWTGSIPDPGVLPVAMTSFKGKNLVRYNQLEWVTASELHNDYFTIERSEDGKHYEGISMMKGAGTAGDVNSYVFQDFEFKDAINYYRIKQTDFDGTKTYSFPISIDNRSAAEKSIVKVINLYGQEVDEHYKGVVIIVYSDDSILRTIRD